MAIESNKPKQTLVEEGTEFKGTLKSSCAVVVNGTIDGEVDAPDITVTRSGSVAGTLKATKVKSQGTISGKVEASDVFLSGSVRSNTSIKAKRLEVKLGSDKGELEVTFGECNLEVGDVASEEASTSTSSESQGSSSTSGEGWAALDGSEETSSAASSSSSTASSGSGGRSSWKSSRVIEASSSLLDGTKSTLR